MNTILDGTPIPRQSSLFRNLSMNTHGSIFVPYRRRQQTVAMHGEDWSLMEWHEDRGGCRDRRVDARYTTLQQWANATAYHVSSKGHDR